MPKFNLSQLILYFLKLGATGFGGPIALVGYMHKDLVESKKWFTEEEFKNGMTLAQLAPGPMATQLCIFLGYVHFRVLGATLVGLAFIIPSFMMVVLIGMAYVAYGGLPWMQAVFYGVGAAVIGIIGVSSYKLTIKSIGGFSLESFKSKWMLWVLFGMAMVSTYLSKQESILLLIGSGLLYMMVKAPPIPLQSTKLNSLILFPLVSLLSTDSTLVKIAIFFGKAGSFVFGSGLAIVPFLHSGVVLEHHWLTEQQFLDAVAVAMITPEPVVITVGFIGYLVMGFSGALVAALATFIPCYIFTILPAPYFNKIVENGSIKSFVEGITAAVIGALVGSVFIIAQKSIVDISTGLIALLSILVLIYVKKVQEPVMIIIAAIVGLGLKTYL
jgi:chromate transporter